MNIHSLSICTYFAVEAIHSSLIFLGQYYIIIRKHLITMLSAACFFLYRCCLCVYVCVYLKKKRMYSLFLYQMFLIFVFVSGISHIVNISVLDKLQEKVCVNCIWLFGKQK